MKYLVIAAITYALNILDMIFTIRLVADYGLDIEANPIGKLMLQNNKITVICKLVFVGIGLAVLYLLSRFLIAKIVLIAMLVIYSLLTLYHVAIRIYLKVNKL